MADSYHIIDGQVVPFHGGRKDTNTGAWRDATPLELQLQEQLAAAEEALAEAAAALEAAREDSATVRDAAERCYRMLLSEPDTNGALFKAENILREAIAETDRKEPRND